eukprot:3469535-Alexandrium_andersonii.AAC.1
MAALAGATFGSLSRTLKAPRVSPSRASAIRAGVARSWSAAFSARCVTRGASTPRRRGRKAASLS